jgi:hypothetical protein
MRQSDLPVFPQFKWDGYHWASSAQLPAWSGYQIRNGPYGRVSAPGRSDGTLRLRFAPEGRDEGPLTGHEIELVRWVVHNQAAAHDAMLDRLFVDYPAMREEMMEVLDPEEARELLPEIRQREQLKDIVGVRSINVHQIEQGGKPFIGVELGCTWEEEHGLGVLLHGAQALEVGFADKAILLWVAKRHLSQP